MASRAELERPMEHKGINPSPLAPRPCASLREPLAGNQPPDVHDLLRRAIMARIGEAHCRLLSGEARGWASATFAGQRHQWCFLAEAHAAQAFAAEAAELEFDFPGHLVADLVAEANADGLWVEALTVEVG